MIYRLGRSAALVGSLWLAACSSSGSAPAPAKTTSTTQVVEAAPQPAPDVPPEQQLSASHGSKWQGDDSMDDGDSAGGQQGGFKGFKEVWVYADGKPVGVLREVELPPLPEVWTDEVEYLDFKAGDPGPHEKHYQTRSWRLADYLQAVGVPLKKIKVVMIHAGKGVLFIPGDLFRQFKNDILFDLIGQQGNKLRVRYPEALNKHLNNSFDRFVAVSVIVDKPMPTLDEHDRPVIDGVVAEGIPYYGQPLRGGVRVYKDGELAMVIKRNSLGDEGMTAPGSKEWSVGKLLAAHAIDSSKIGAIDVLDPNQVVKRLDSHDVDSLVFHTATQASGAVVLSSGETMTALMLWTAGKIPPVHQQTPGARDDKGPIATPATAIDGDEDGAQ